MGAKNSSESPPERTKLDDEVDYLKSIYRLTSDEIIILNNAVYSIINDIGFSSNQLGE